MPKPSDTRPEKSGADSKPGEDPKVDTYRDTLQEMGKHGRKPAAQDEATRELEGKAAKLGTEVQKEQTKAPPRNESGRESGAGAALERDPGPANPGPADPTPRKPTQRKS